MNKFEQVSNPLATRCRSWGSMSAGRQGVVQGLTSGGGVGPEWGVGLYSEVQDIMGNHHMGTPPGLTE